jgi:GNAT superfamily N-acetyltransferase
MIQIDNSTPATVELAPFTETHLPGALVLSQASGWPHRLEDWSLGLSVSQGVAAIEGGCVVGTGLCSFHGRVATLNMIIVDASMRGLGLGRQVMERIIALAGDREMRLVATDVGLPLYRKLGFIEAGRIMQLQGLARAASPEQRVRIGPADIGVLAAMDLAASGMRRQPLLERIADMGETLTTDGGFALLRAFGRGHVIGPVVASGPTAAGALIAAAASHMAGRFLRVDLPQDLGLAPFVESLGLSPVGGGTAMVRAPIARPATDFQTYALISQALG